MQNDVEGSAADFDAALAARPAIRPYLWQRGLSLYYLQQYQEGAQQVGAAGALAAQAARPYAGQAALQRCIRTQPSLAQPGNTSAFFVTPFFATALG